MDPQPSMVHHLPAARAPRSLDLWVLVMVAAAFVGVQGIWSLL